MVWQNSTENVWYKMVQIPTVEQVRRNEGFLEFDCTMLLQDFASQEIVPWQMQVLWCPQHGTKVKRQSRRQRKHDRSDRRPSAP